MLQFSIICAIAGFFFLLERLAPGRELPESPGWYARALFLNGCQLAIVMLGGVTWNHWFQGVSLFRVSAHMPPLLQGFLGWFLGTFIFYWWHRARHQVNVLWRVFHQVHHSPARIEALTAFYKHPVEITADAIIMSALMYSVLGASLAGAAWFNVFAVFGEFFYHSNLRTPHWMGYFLQRPEHHSIHHQLDVHKFNFGDITWWDRLFGTFREADKFAAQCGFPEQHQRQLAAMLMFRDRY